MSSASACRNFLLGTQTAAVVDGGLVPVWMLNYATRRKLFGCVYVACLKHSSMMDADLADLLYRALEWSPADFDRVKRALVLVPLLHSLESSNMPELLVVVNRHGWRGEELVANLFNVREELMAGVYGDKALVLPLMMIDLEQLKTIISAHTPEMVLHELLKDQELLSFFKVNARSSRSLVFRQKLGALALCWADPHSCKVAANMLSELARRSFGRRKTPMPGYGAPGGIDDDEEQEAGGQEQEEAVCLRGGPSYLITYNPTTSMGKDAYVKLLGYLAPPDAIALQLHVLVSKDACHLVLNNGPALEHLASLYAGHYDVLRYAMSYGFLTLYLEAHAKRSNITKGDRFVFDIDTAAKLPHFPTRLPRCNPYLPFVGRDSLLVENVLGPDLVYGPGIEYGIVPLATFEERLDAFITGGTRQRGVLNGVDWSRFAVTGSAIAACAPRFNPVMLSVGGRTPQERFVAFLEEYYGDSDVDVICNVADFAAFRDAAYAFADTVGRNVGRIPRVDIIKSAVFRVSPGFLKRHGVLAEDTDAIRQLLYDGYLEYEEATGGVGYGKPAPLDDVHVVILNGRPRHEESVKYDTAIKFKVHVPTLRVFELFYGAGLDFFAQVHRFHLQVVRGYYDGTTCWLLPDVIVAAHTLLNIDIKYFHSRTNGPIDIINKYRCRGYGVLLNGREMRRYIKAMQERHPALETSDILTSSGRPSRHFYGHLDASQLQRASFATNPHKKLVKPGTKGWQRVHTQIARRWFGVEKPLVMVPTTAIADGLILPLEPHFLCQ